MTISKIKLNVFPPPFQSFDSAIVSSWASIMAGYQAFTDSFLEPFNAMYALEYDEVTNSVPWVIEGSVDL